MDQKTALLANVLELDVSSQIDLLRSYFTDKRFPVLLRTESLTFQTEITAVLVNHAKFVQAKGKTREESERFAVKKAWERVIAKGKEGEFMGIWKRMMDTEGKHHQITVMTSGIPMSPACLGSFVHTPIHGRDIASAPMTPLDARDAVSKVIESNRGSDQLDSLISAAAKAVEITKTPPSPPPRRQLSIRSSIHKSLPTESNLRSLFHPSLQSRLQPNSLLPRPQTDRKGEKFSLQSVMETEEIKRLAKRFQYRSLADARFEVKMKRASLSYLQGSKDGEDREKDGI